MLIHLWITVCLVLTTTQFCSVSSTYGQDNGDPNAPCTLQDCATVEPTQLGVRLYTGDKPGGIRFAIFPKKKPSSPGVLQSGEVINDQQWTQLWLYWTENCPAVTSVSNFNEKCMQDSGRTTIMGKTFNWNSDDRDFYWYGVSGQSNLHPQYARYRTVNEYVDVSSGTYKFKSADAQGDGWGNAQFSLCFANMNECLGNYNPNNAKVYADPKGFRGGASIALQKADYTYTNLLSSSIEKVVTPSITCPNGYYCKDAGSSTYEPPIRCGCTRSRPGQEENCDWATASNYYCPAGTTTRKVVDRSAGYCGARPINYDTFRYTAQALCPRLNITFDSTSAVVSNSRNLTTNTDTYSIYMEITQPGTGTVGMSFRNVGAATGNYGREWNTQSELPTYADLSGEEWGTIAANSNKKKMWENGIETLVPAELSISIDSGALDPNAEIQFQYVMYFHGSGNWDDRQKIYLQFRVQVHSPGSMLVFPFAINSNLRVGDISQISLFIFNIGKGGDIPYYNVTVPSEAARFMGIQRQCEVSGNCAIEAAPAFQRVTVTLSADLPSRTSPYRTVFTVSSPNGTVPVQVRITIAVGKTNSSTTTANYINLPEAGVEKSIYDKCYPVCNSANDTVAMEYRNCYTNDIIVLAATDAIAKCGSCQTSKTLACQDVPVRTFTTEVRAPIEIVIQAHDKYSANSVDEDIFVVSWKKLQDSETSLDQAQARSGQANAIRVDGNTYSTNVVPEWRGNYLVQIWRKLNKPDLVTLCNSAPLNHTQCYDKIKFDKVLQAINVNCPQSASNNERGDACLCNAGYEPLSTKGIKHKCKKCVAGRFKGEVGEDACAKCGPGSYAATDGATNCTLSPSGYRPNALVEATGIINCNSGTSDKYAPEGSSECKTCPVPLEILQGSEAASIDDCVCPAGYYKQRREDGTFKDCISCPSGAICKQGTENIENIQGKPGFWRPSTTTAEFWPCNVPTTKESNTEWNLWLNCLGGAVSTCAPVFRWDKAMVPSEDGEDMLVSEALTAFNLKRSVDDLGTYANMSTTKIWFSTIYVAYISSLKGMQFNDSKTTVSFGDWIDKARTIPGYAWIGGKPAMDYNQELKATQNAILGYYSGPICSICPFESGRDGDFSSSSVCTPCPEAGNNSVRLIGLTAVAVLMISLMIISQISKGSHERELALAHTEEHNKDLDSMHDDEVRKNHRDIQDNDGVEEISQNINGAAEADNVEKKGTHSALLEKQTSYYGVQDVKEKAYDSVLRRKELQKQNGTRSGKLISHKQILTGMSRIFFSYLQVSALARSLPIAWPSEVESILDTMATFASPSLSLTSIDCAIADNKTNVGGIYAKFWMTMMIPVLAVCVPVTVWSMYYLVGHMAYGSKSGEGCCFKSLVKDKKMEHEKATKINRHKLIEKTTRRILVSSIVTLFLFYPTTCKGVVKMWACKTYGDYSYLVADLSVECYKGEHKLYIGLAVVFFILYCIGIPLLAFLVLRPYIAGIHFDPRLPISSINPPGKHNYEAKDRKALLKLKLTAASTYGFMWQGFQQAGMAPYWEATVINSRKLVLIMLIELLQDFPSNYQMVFALIVLFFYNLLHVNYHPYDSYYHDRLEFLSLVVSELTLFFGLLLNFMEADKNCLSGCLIPPVVVAGARGTISGFIIFCNCLFLAYFGFGFMYHIHFLLPKKLRCIGNATSKLHHKIASMKYVGEVYKTALPNVNHKVLITDDNDNNEEINHKVELTKKLELVTIMRRAGLKEDARQHDLHIKKEHNERRAKALSIDSSYSFSSIDKVENDEDDDIEDSRDTGIIDNESDDESELEDDSNIDTSDIDKANSTVSDLDQAFRMDT